MFVKNKNHSWVAILLTLLTLFTLTPALTLASAYPAYAEAEDVPGGAGNGGANGGYGGGDPNCTRPAMTGSWGGHKDHYLAPFPGCYGQSFQTVIKDCPVGFDVWRFYGTESNPSMYTTVSKVNLPNWCQENRTYRYFLPNPQDSNASPAGPWSSTTFTNPYGETVNMAYSSGDCGDPRNSTTCYATTNRPWRFMINGSDNASQTCANLQTDQSTLGKYFSGPYMDPTAAEYASGKTVRTGMLSLFRRWAVSFGSPIALTAINAANPAPTTPDNINFNDNVNCSSALDFVTTSNAPNKVIMGSCVIPINRPARAYTGGTYAFYNYAYNNKLGSTHYTAEYAAKAASQKGGVYDSWRAMIQHEVATRGGTVGVDYPGQIYSFSGTVQLKDIPTFNQAQAAADAANNAYCVKGESSTISSAVSTEAGIVADSVVIKVTAPDVFQVGGALKPGSVTTDKAVLMCGNRACNHAINPLDPTLASLTYTLDLTGVNFSKCRDDHSAGCDYYLKIPARANMDGQSVTAWFFSGTNPDEKVQVTLTNLSAAQQVYKTTTTDLTTCVPSSSVSGVGAVNSDCETVTLTDNVKDGPPRPVQVKADLGNRNVINVPASGVVLEKEVIGAVTTGSTY